MTKRNGYDLGGSEQPHDPACTVIDIEPIPDYVEDREDYEYVHKDLRTDFTDLEPRHYIKIGQFIRYLVSDGGYLMSDPIDYKTYQLFGQRLYKIWKGPGTIVIFDHIALIEQVIMGLFEVASPDDQIDIKYESVNLSDEDMAGDWEVTITRS